MLGCQKTDLIDVEDKIAPVYHTTIIRKELIEGQFQRFCRAETKRATVYATRGQLLENGIKRKHLLVLHICQFY